MTRGGYSSCVRALLFCSNEKKIFLVFSVCFIPFTVFGFRMTVAEPYSFNIVIVIK